MKQNLQICKNHSDRRPSHVHPAWSIGTQTQTLSMGSDSPNALASARRPTPSRKSFEPGTHRPPYQPPSSQVLQHRSAHLTTERLFACVLHISSPPLMYLVARSQRLEC